MPIAHCICIPSCAKNAFTCVTLVIAYSYPCSCCVFCTIIAPGHSPKTAMQYSLAIRGDVMTDENPVDQPDGDRHFVTALARGLAILKCFRSGEELLGNQELALRCDLPKSTITRLTYTLAKLGYLHKSGQQPRYRLGMKTLTLGGTTLARLNVKQISQSLMRLLSEETESLISLGIRDDISMHYIESHRGNALITLNLG